MGLRALQICNSFSTGTGTVFRRQTLTSKRLPALKELNMTTVRQSLQKAVSAYFTIKQILPCGFADHYLT